MADDSTSRPSKRARGSYAKLICFNCRERRIKCKLPINAQPSPAPQPTGHECERCQHHGLECIVRKTTLGRPSQKRQAGPATPPPTDPNVHEESRSPSPDPEQFVLLMLNDRDGDPGKITALNHERPTNVQLMQAITKTFDLTSALLARDKRFASAVAGLQDTSPVAISDLINENMAALLDQHLVWLRVYMPYLPSLVTLHQEVSESDTKIGSVLSATLLLALLCSIALDLPSEVLANYRHLQSKLRSIIYHVGQKVLFSLPRHEYTLTAFELVNGYRPLALINSQQAAAHTLTGNLYSTLAKSIAQQLGFDSAAATLRKCLKANGSGNIPQLIADSLRWCSCLMNEIGHELEEVESSRGSIYRTQLVLIDALEVIGDAMNADRPPVQYFLLYHMLRASVDDLATIRELTMDWESLSKLAGHVDAHKELHATRKADFEQGLIQNFYRKGRTEEAIAFSQLSNMELNVGRSNVMGLSMFYAIMSGSHKIGNIHDTNLETRSQLRRYYSDCIDQEFTGDRGDGKSGVRSFLDQFGDAHMDELENKLTDFINVASEVRLHGMPFSAPPRHTTSHVLFACKEIVENNAVRIRIDKSLHSRVDIQLILILEAAKRLEAMEADGGSPEAVARGSIFTASAKLIRCLHRIMWEWKRGGIQAGKLAQYGEQRSQAMDMSSSSSSAAAAAAAQHDSPFEMPSVPPMDIGLDDFFADGLFTDWDNWPQLDPTDLSTFFTQDLGASNF